MSDEDFKETRMTSFCGENAGRPCHLLSEDPERKGEERFNKDPEEQLNTTGILGWPKCYHDGWSVFFETLPTFGCIHHETKEKENK